MSQQKELENKIIDFVHGNCKNIYDETVIDCKKFWEDFQSDLYAPGCAECSRRATLKKYGELVDVYYRHSNVNYRSVD